VVSAQLTEGHVPLHYFGAATGILSVIGFLPDTFSSIWFGAIMDSQVDGAGNVAAGAYEQIFLILIVAAVLAAIASFVLFAYVKRNNAKLAAAGAVNGDAVDEDATDEQTA
jgi:phosphate/sulfate permease